MSAASQRAINLQRSPWPRMFTLENTPSPPDIIFPVSRIYAFGRHMLRLWHFVGEDAYQLTKKPIDPTRRNGSFSGSGHRHLSPTELTDDFFVSDPLRPMPLPLTKPDGMFMPVLQCPLAADMGNLDGGAISVASLALFRLQKLFD